MLSAIVPVYNGGEKLDALMLRLEPVLRKADPDFEIIFIDDGSTDGSLGVLRRLCAPGSRASYASFSRNFGQQAAVLCGLRLCRGDLAVTIDDDLGHPPESIPEMIAALVGYDAVYAVPAGGGSSGGTARDALFSLLLGKPRGLRIGSYRLFSRDAVVHIARAQGLFVYISAELFGGGFRVCSIEYPSDEKDGQESRYNLLRRIKLYLRLLLWYMPAAGWVLRRFRRGPQYIIAERGGEL